MNTDVEITLFVLGILIGICITFLSMLYADHRTRTNTKTVYALVPKQEPKPQVKSDDWKTYEKVYESEEK